MSVRSLNGRHCNIIHMHCHLSVAIQNRQREARLKSTSKQSESQQIIDYTGEKVSNMGKLCVGWRSLSVQV